MGNAMVLGKYMSKRARRSGNLQGTYGARKLHVVIRREMRQHRRAWKIPPAAGSSLAPFKLSSLNSEIKYHKQRAKIF